MILSFSAENAFGKIQHSFLTKIYNKLGYRRKYLNIIKATYAKPTANIILNDKGWKLHLISGIKQGCLFIPLLINIVLEVLAKTIKQDKEIKGIRIRKEEVKLSLFVDDTMLYIEKFKDVTKKPH